MSGIIDEHEFLNEKDGKVRKIYLDSENKQISVPKIIYKVVEYRLENCVLDEGLCWYSAIIVIDNVPDFYEHEEDNEKLCTKDVTIDWGWEEITKDFEGNQSEIIYVCENDENVRRKLSIDLRSREQEGGLKLSNFVLSRDGGKTLVEMDIKPFVDRRFRILSNEGENIPDIESGTIVERAQFRNDVFAMSLKSQMRCLKRDRRKKNEK